MRLAHLLAVLTVVGCGASRPPEAQRVATDTANAPAELRAPDVNLSGSWQAGTGDEPQVDSITLYPSCVVVPAVWLIEQEGNALRAWAFPERYNRGVHDPRDVATRVAPARGTISGSDVLLDDGTYRYVLRYDTASSHLRGTRNGERFWAVRQKVVSTAFCPPPP